MLGGTDSPLQLMRQPSTLGGRDGRGQSLLGTGVLARRGEDFAGSHPLDDAPLRCGGFTGVRVQDREGLVRTVHGEEPTGVDLPQGEEEEKQHEPRHRVEPLPASFDGSGELARQSCVTGSPGEQCESSALSGLTGGYGDGALQTGDGGFEATGFAKFVAVHPKGVRQEVVIVQVPGQNESFAGPGRGTGEAFLRQHSAERDAERQARGGEQMQGVTLKAAFGGASFETGGQRPQLVDGFDDPAGLAGDLGQPDRAVTELHARGEIGVVGIGDAEQVERQPQCTGDVPTPDNVTRGALAGFDHRDVGLVVAEQEGKRLLAEPVRGTVGAQDGREVSRAECRRRARVGPHPDRGGQPGRPRGEDGGRGAAGRTERGAGVAAQGRPAAFAVGHDRYRTGCGARRRSNQAAIERLYPSGIRNPATSSSANSPIRRCSWLCSGAAFELDVQPYVTMKTSFLATAMWYTHASRIPTTSTGNPDSSVISRATHCSGISPSSIRPPGSSHSSRSLCTSSTRPSRISTPLIDTGYPVSATGTSLPLSMRLVSPTVAARIGRPRRRGG